MYMEKYSMYMEKGSMFIPNYLISVFHDSADLASFCLGLETSRNDW